MIRQNIVFIENKAGSLQKVTESIKAINFFFMIFLLLLNFALTKFHDYLGYKRL